VGADLTRRELFAAGWFGPKGLATYTGMKRAELDLAGAALDDALCARYAAIY